MIGPGRFELTDFVARCERLSRDEVLAFAKREDERAASARRRVTGRGATGRRREIQGYADAMGKLLNIVEYGSPAILGSHQRVLEPLIDRLLREGR